RQQVADLVRLRLDRRLLIARVLREICSELRIARVPVGLPLLGVDGRAETRMARQRPQVQAFEPEADQPQRRIHERAEQRERRDAEPVRRYWHAEGTSVEGCGQVGTLGAHVGAGCAAYL